MLSLVSVDVFFGWLVVCLYIFWPFYGFIDRTAEDMTGNRDRERGSDTQQRDPGWELNPGPLQRLGTWDAFGWLVGWLFVWLLGCFSGEDVGWKTMNYCIICQSSSGLILGNLMTLVTGF